MNGHLKFWLLVAGQKEAFVVSSLDQLVDSISVRLNNGRLDGTILIRFLQHILDHFAAPLFCSLNNEVNVFHSKSDHLNAVTKQILKAMTKWWLEKCLCYIPVLDEVITQGSMFWVELGHELKDNILQVHNVANHLSGASFQPLVSQWLEAHVHAIEGCRLLGVTDDKADMVKVNEAPFLRFDTFVRVRSHFAAD